MDEIFKKSNMIYPLLSSKSLSRNIYVRRSQIINRIDKLRQIHDNQKFSNDITYSFNDILASINYYKINLRSTNQEIDLQEKAAFSFGL